MGNAIYLVDPDTRVPVRVEQVDLSDIGIKERADLEAWVVANPELLGERHLVISVEFYRFDKSAKRLDILAIDERGALVIVELKLDIEGSHADLQAIRYAAFCSTMTMQDVVEELAATKCKSEEEAENALLAFLEVDELPELGDRPRVILAAGSIEDQEITSCVLWLRKFGLDITCVELAPFRMPGGSIAIVPKTIIPLPETRAYTVEVEKKEVAKTERSKSQEEDAQLWSLVKQKFNSLPCPLKVGMNSYQQWLDVRGGSLAVHYAWWRLRKKRKAIWIGIGFRSKDAKENDEHMELFRPREAELSAALGIPLHFQYDWGPVTRRMYVELPYDGTQPIESIAMEASERMEKLIGLTLPTLVKLGLHPAQINV